MNLEQQKKQARELLRAVRSGNADALTRLRQHRPEWSSSDDAAVIRLAALHDAQFVLAREQGFASWPKLKAYAEPTTLDGHSRLFVPDMSYLEDRVYGLLRTRASGVPQALEQIRQWHPKFADCNDEEIRTAPFTEEDGRLVYAREHGFDSWSALAKRVESLAAAPETEPFMAAFLCLKASDMAGLGRLLTAHPDLATARGTNGNTLLHLAGSIHRTPDYSRILLEAGADVNSANDRGWTPLHQTGYSNKVEIAELLLRYGASIEAEGHGSGGTPLIAALFWGHREAAEVLAGPGVVPHNLRSAAGLGRLPLVESLFDSSGRLMSEAFSARGFYRPHSGFPDWEPSDDPQEVLDEALVWACKSDRVSVLPRLVAGGARVDADPYRGTPLTWAAGCDALSAAEWLLDHGANVNQRGTFGGPDHGQGVTACHIAAQSGHLEMVKLLVSRGTDLSIEDELHGGRPIGWARHGGQTEVAEYLESVS